MLEGNRRAVAGRRVHATMVVVLHLAADFIAQRPRVANGHPMCELRLARAEEAAGEGQILRDASATRMRSARKI